MNRKQLNSVSLGIAWMVSLGVVFILGILSAFALHLKPGTGNSTSSGLTIEQREMALTIERYTGEAADIAAIMNAGTGNPVPEQLEQTIRAILRENDTDQRAMAASRLVGGLPSRRVMAGIRFLQEIPVGPARDQVLGRFLEVWAKGDGRSAIAFAISLESLHERELAIRSVLRGWSQYQPAEAWNWVIERGGTSRRSERWLEIILASLGNTNRETAIRLIERLPDPGFQARMSVVVMDQILQVEPPREAINWLTELPDGAVGEAAAFLAQAWAQTEPRAAALWLRQAFPGETGGMEGILREWAYVAPEEAADWVWDNLSGSARSDLMDVVAGEWIANDGPTPLAQWLNTHGPSSALDGAVENLALATAEFDPATALVWAQSVTDPDTRSMLEILIGREWIRLAPADAADNLPLLLESDAARATLLEADYLEAGDTGFEETEAPLGSDDFPAQ